MKRLVGITACLLALCAGADAAVLTRPGFDLRYDESVWRESASPPPTILALDCIAAGCGAGVSVTVVADDRPLPRPGAGAFMPGAVSAALVAIRAASLVPGVRLESVSPVAPAAFGAFGGYLSRHVIVDRNLVRRDMIHALVRLDQGRIQIAMIGDALPATADRQFSDLLDGLARPGTLAP